MFMPILPPTVALKPIRTRHNIVGAVRFNSMFEIGSAANYSERERIAEFGIKSGASMAAFVRSCDAVNARSSVVAN
jgi:hypothetical protein